MAQENRTRIDIHVGRPGRGRRERAGISHSYGADWWGGTGSACGGAGAGLCPTHSVTFHIQFCFFFWFCHLFSVCECRREEKQNLGDSSMASQKGTLQFLFHSQNNEWLCHFLPSHRRFGAVTPVPVLSVWFSFEYWDAFPVQETSVWDIPVQRACRMGHTEVLGTFKYQCCCCGHFHGTTGQPGQMPLTGPYQHSPWCWCSSSLEQCTPGARGQDEEESEWQGGLAQPGPVQSWQHPCAEGVNCPSTLAVSPPATHQSIVTLLELCLCVLGGWCHI